MGVELYILFSQSLSVEDINRWMEGYDYTMRFMSYEDVKLYEEFVERMDKETDQDKRYSLYKVLTDAFPFLFHVIDPALDDSKETKWKLFCMGKRGFHALNTWDQMRKKRVITDCCGKLTHEQSIDFAANFMPKGFPIGKLDYIYWG